MWLGLGCLEGRSHRLLPADVVAPCSMEGAGATATSGDEWAAEAIVVVLGISSVRVRVLVAVHERIGFLHASGIGARLIGGEEARLHWLEAAAFCWHRAVLRWRRHVVDELAREPASSEASVGVTVMAVEAVVLRVTS